MHFRVSGFSSHESLLESATRLYTRGLLLSGALVAHPMYFRVSSTPTRLPTTTPRYKTRVSARVYDSARHSGATPSWGADRAQRRSSSGTLQFLTRINDSTKDSGATPIRSAGRAPDSRLRYYNNDIFFESYVESTTPLRTRGLLP